MNRIRWIVFDAVGTLIFPNPPVARVYWNAGRQQGSRLSESDVAERFREAFAEFEHSEIHGADVTSRQALRTSEEQETRRWRHIVTRVLDDVADIEPCFLELYEHFATAAAWSPFPDAEPALRELHQRGWQIGIASNFDKRLNRVVNQLPLGNCTQFSVPSSVLGYRKPSVRFFGGVCRLAQCSPHEMLYIGDDWSNDVVAARSAGLAAVQIDRRAVESDADRLTDLRQLPSLLPNS